MEEIRDFCALQQWFFWFPADVQRRVTALAQVGYENDPVILAAKILLK